MRVETAETESTRPTPAPKLGRRLGLGAAALGAAALLARPAAAQAAGPSDADILNYLLNFEYLAAEFYIAAVNNSALLTPFGTAPEVLPSQILVPFANPAVGYYGIRLAADELAHVGVVQGGADELAGQPDAIPPPQINLDTNPTTGAWSLAAQAAGLVKPGKTFDPYANQVDFMLGAFMLEDVRVTALCGVLSLLTTLIGIEYVTGLIGVTAMQAAAVRTYLADIGAGAATNAISSMRARLSGTTDTGTLIPGNPYNFANLDYNGLATPRAPNQVLAIAYGGSGLTSGLFFPDGINGYFAGTVSA